FGISKGEKIALIARNGSGKSTLMKILAGKDVPDSGQVTYRKDTHIEFLEQDPLIDTSKTVLEAIFDYNNPSVQLMRDYEDVLEKVQLHPTLELHSELQSLSTQIDNAGAWDYEVRVRQILSKLNI